MAIAVRLAVRLRRHAENLDEMSGSYLTVQYKYRAPSDVVRLDEKRIKMGEFVQDRHGIADT